MVTIEYMRGSVMRCRKDTVFRRAFARAFGMEICDGSPDVPVAVPHVSVYAGMEECFANRETAMDGRVV